MYWTSYSDCLTGFREPLSPPDRCHTCLKNVLCAYRTCNFRLPVHPHRKALPSVTLYKTVLLERFSKTDEKSLPPHSQSRVWTVFLSISVPTRLLTCSLHTKYKQNKLGGGGGDLSIYANDLWTGWLVHSVYSEFKVFDYPDQVPAICFCCLWTVTIPVWQIKFGPEMCIHWLPVSVSLKIQFLGIRLLCFMTCSISTFLLVQSPSIFP